MAAAVPAGPAPTTTASNFSSSAIAPNPNSMKVIGLTGGVGSGKSTVAEMLRELGATVVDADEAAHEVYAPGTPGFDAVVAEFGSDFVHDGASARDHRRPDAYRREAPARSPCGGQQRHLRPDPQAGRRGVGPDVRSLAIVPPHLVGRLGGGAGRNLIPPHLGRPGGGARRPL